jgi:site-specific DNA recombinase
MSRRGKKTGAASISRGHLYWILSNPVFVGRLRHKGRIHDGLHPAIEDIEPWDRVQDQLKSQRQTRRTSCPDDQSFLAGKLYDDRGNRMGASYATKAGGAGETTCRGALSGRKQDSGSVVRVPASEIEIRVANRAATVPRPESTIGSSCCCTCAVTTGTGDAAAGAEAGWSANLQWMTANAAAAKTTRPSTDL